MMPPHKRDKRPPTLPYLCMFILDLTWPEPSPEMSAGPELLFNEVAPGLADLPSLGQTTGVQRQEDLHSEVQTVRL